MLRGFIPIALAFAESVNTKRGVLRANPMSFRIVVTQGRDIAVGRLQPRRRRDASLPETHMVYVVL